MMDVDRRSEEVLSVYFDWLVSLVGEEWWGHTYHSLLWRLFNMEYYWTLPMDENRSDDGKALREEFWDIFPHFYRDEAMLGPAVVLEVLIGLARRVEFEVAGKPLEAIFWKMMENLRVLGASDDLFCSAHVAWTDDIFGRWMSNSTEWHSPFWQEHPDFDPSTTELWYQMHAYLRKNSNF